MIWVINAEYIDGYKVLVTFNTGEKKVVDLEYRLKKGIFVPLAEEDYFKTFSVKNDTLSWENGADIAPESLYKKGKIQV